MANELSPLSNQSGRAAVVDDIGQRKRPVSNQGVPPGRSSPWWKIVASALSGLVRAEVKVSNPTINVYKNTTINITQQRCCCGRCKR
jgi:hypothetical protein